MERLNNKEDFSISTISLGEFNAVLNSYNFCPETVYHYFGDNQDPDEIGKMLVSECDRRNEEEANKDYNKFIIHELGRLACCREEYHGVVDMKVQLRMDLARVALAFKQRPEIIENGYSYDQDEYDDLCGAFETSLLLGDHLSSEDK